MIRNRAAVFLILVPLIACEREQRQFRPNPVATETSQQVILSPLAPGPFAAPAARAEWGKQFENNAYHLSHGQRLYAWFNCNGCHANGGGDSGPALMDDRWIYGGSIENIVQTIREGRPNGMPSFRGKIPDDQIWQIAAYVRSMFEQWRTKQIAARDPPADPERQQGERVFLSSPCVMCHTIRGTAAGGKVGPDLTHIASRKYLAAGVLPKTRDTLAAWIVDPQRVKPGANMPTIKLEPDNLNSLLSYLEGLQ